MSTDKTLIFSDLDGTLLDHFTYQSEETRSIIIQLKEADIPVILNTSKTHAELIDIQSELSLDTPFIIENGAAVFIPKSTFSDQPSETTEIDHYWIKSFSSPREYWVNLLESTCQEYQGLYQSFSTLSVEALSKITGLTYIKAAQAKERQYGEPVQWLGDESSKKSFIEHLINFGANVVQGGRFIHLGGYCDKGQALTWLAECYRDDYQKRFGESSIYTIALGDGENDISMLESADVAVQIRSPVHEFPTLYRQCRQTIQTEQYGPAGWAEAIKKLLFKQPITKQSTFNIFGKG